MVSTIRTCYWTAWPPRTNLRKCREHVSHLDWIRAMQHKEPHVIKLASVLCVALVIFLRFSWRSILGELCELYFFRTIISRCIPGLKPCLTHQFRAFNVVFSLRKTCSPLGFVHVGTTNWVPRTRLRGVIAPKTENTKFWNLACRVKPYTGRVVSRHFLRVSYKIAF